MIRQALLYPCFVFVAASVTGCFSPKNEGGLEGAYARQEKWLEKQVEKSERRRQTWDQRWENYSKKQDQKYYEWRDKMLRD